jgi:uncharacterized membrane protein YvlD (DUF360 family)
MNWERKRKSMRICGLFFSCLRLLTLGLFTLAVNGVILYLVSLALNWLFRD